MAKLLSVSVFIELSLLKAVVLAQCRTGHCVDIVMRLGSVSRVRWINSRGKRADRYTGIMMRLILN